MMRSLRNRLIFSYLLVLVAMAGLFFLATNRIIEDQFYDMAYRGGQAFAKRLAADLADFHTFSGGWEGVEDFFDRSFLRPDHDEMQKPGEDLMDKREGRGPWFSTDEQRFIVLDVNGETVYDSNPQGEPIKDMDRAMEEGIPIMVDEKQVGTVLVAATLGKLSALQDMFIKQVNLVMLLAAVGCVVAVLIYGTLQARKIVAPVRALSEASRKVAEGDYSQQIPVTSRDELGEMAAAFNTMASDLERQRELRYRATADMAHELRTPLSVLQVELESLEDGINEPTAEVIGNLKQEVFYLTRLVENLRMLAAADAGELMMDLQPLEIKGLVDVVVNRLREAAREKGIALLTNPDGEDLLVAGDDQRLAQVLLNLLSNALHFTPSGGEVSISVEQVENRVHVSVSDNGIGIAAEDLPHVFERLYRSDRARQRENGSSGLGLAIARSLVEAHGGHIWVESKEGEGSMFTFSLPLVEK